mgnify:CR=1 FL=1
MKVRRLKVQNFRAINLFLMDNIGDAVVVAGANGAGKSHVYHALRLLKSMYGEYNQNELQQWFAEFKLNVKQDTRDLSRLFRDPESELVIEATFEFTDAEIEAILEPRRVFVGSAKADEDSLPLSADDLAPLAAPQKQQLDGWLKVLKAETSNGQRTFTGVVVGYRDEETAKLVLAAHESPVLQAAFRIFDPSRVGIIDYYGPQRVYNREGYGHLNVQLRDAAHGRREYRTKALYNYTGKFSNIKQELARAYVKGLLQREAAGDDAKVTEESKLQDLARLFQTFFPHKEFSGPQPTASGALEFRIKDRGSDTEYDIDELSSGEKELLFGYLTIYNAAPKNSVVLIDEPELHLNPAMLRGLTSFYRESFGEALGGQVWLITHSDTIIREAAADPQYSVFHLRRAGKDEAIQQATRIGGRDALQEAMVDLVGNLAQYDPTASNVVLEGGGDSQYDVRVVEKLFPSFALENNLISGSGKVSAKLLRRVLDDASEQGTAFFAILDRDDHTDADAYEGDGVRVYNWDRYHIENYLLDDEAISAVMRDAECVDMAPEAVREALRKCARARIDLLVRHRVRRHIARQLDKLVRVPGAKSGVDVVEHFGQKVEDIQQKVQESLTSLDPNAIQALVDGERQALSASCDSDDWRSTVPGREILLEFVHQHCHHQSYQGFRNLVLSTMARMGRKPPGMAEVLQSIEAEAENHTADIEAQ